MILDELRAGEEGEWIVSLSIITGDLPQADRVFGKLSATALDVSHDSVSQMVSKHRYDTDEEEEAPGEYYDENTLFKIIEALERAGVSNGQAQMDVIRELQNAGILFRERR